MVSRASARRAHLQRILGIVFSILCLIISGPPYRNAFAATGTIDPNGDGTIGSNWSATPSGSHYTTIDDATRQPVVPNTTDSISIANNRSDTANFRMSSIGSVSVVTSVTVWIYHNDGSNGTVYASLYDSAETNAYGTEQSFTSRSVNAWDSVVFSGLALNQNQLDGLNIRFRVTKGGGPVSTVSIFAMYSVINYTSGTLSVDVVDGNGNSVPSPSADFSSVNAKIDCQSSTGTLGSASQKIRVSNTTLNGNWTLTIAATNGQTALWSNGSNSYDFNDPSGTPAGCSDGADGDSYGGRLTVDPSTGTVTPQTLCNTTGISKGASASFSQGTTDTVTLLSASGSQVACYYELSGVSMHQQIPGEVPASNPSYSINLTLTITAN